MLLISAQLTWWIVFFSMHRDELDGLQKQLDRMYIADANAGGRPASRLYKKTDGTYAVRPEVIKEREEKGKRQLWMLISETGFLLIVIAVGAYRMHKAIRQERELEIARNLFLNNVTHELKTPIAGLQLNLETLLKRKLDEPLREELLREGLSETRRLSEKVNHLLMGTFSGTMKAPADAHSNVLEILNQSLSENKSRISQSKAVVNSEIKDDLFVRIPEPWLLSIFSNLIRNALIYCDRPVIKVTATGTDPLQIHISDNGPGIEPGQLENIFLPLIRLHHNKGFLAGSGMGLYISRRLAEACGGSLKAKNRADGGTDFILELNLYINEDSVN